MYSLTLNYLFLTLIRMKEWLQDRIWTKDYRGSEFEELIVDFVLNSYKSGSKVYTLLLKWCVVYKFNPFFFVFWPMSNQVVPGRQPGTVSGWGIFSGIRSFELTLQMFRWNKKSTMRSISILHYKMMIYSFDW